MATTRRDSSAIRCSEELRDRVHIEAVRASRPMIDVVEEAISEWLDRQSNPDLAAVPAKYRVYMRKLAAILTSGNEQIIEAFIRNLDLFGEFAKPKPRPRRRTSSAQVPSAEVPAQGGIADLER
jgi:predicted DNA-binding protein